MDRIKMVDKLREKAGVSYEEAKEALEKSDWDLLDAIVLLEKEGKVKETSFSTKKEEPEQEKQSTYEHAGQPKNDGVERFLKWVGRVIHKGNTNHIHVYRNNEKQLGLPVTAFALLLVFLFPITMTLLVVGLFLGFHYKFVGKDLGKDGINNVMEKASKAAEAVKEEFKDANADANKETNTEEDKKDE